MMNTTTTILLQQHPSKSDDGGTGRRPNVKGRGKRRRPTPERPQRLTRTVPAMMMRICSAAAAVVVLLSTTARGGMSSASPAPTTTAFPTLSPHPTFGPTPVNSSSSNSSSNNNSRIATGNTAPTASPTQRPSGLFNSYSCVAIKPFLVCGIVTWRAMNCTTVLEEYEFLAGNCCSLTDYGAHGCRLEVNGPNSFCSYKTRFDRKYYSYLIAPSNTGKCGTSQYRVSLPPTPHPTQQPHNAPTTTTVSKYASCFQSTYVSCAGSCGGSTTASTSSTSSVDAFRTKYQRCYGSNAALSGRCVRRSQNRCASRTGRPPTAVCDSLPSVGRTGTLEQSTCIRLKRRCRSTSGSVVCK